jgi:phosphoserine phosphatase RsbU/P
MFDTAEFVSETTPLGLDDTMVLFSDGALEAENPKRQPFGEDRLTQTIAAARNVEIASIPTAIVRALTQWRGRETLEDDLTVLVCQRRPYPDET